MNAGTPPTLLTRVVRGTVRQIAHQIARNAQVKRLARLLLDRMPALQTRVHAWVRRTDERTPHRPHVPDDPQDLSPRTEAMYRQLKRHFEERRR